MTIDLMTVLKGVLIGIGGTVALDLWASTLKALTDTPATNWAMVGRWLGHMPQGRFVHEAIAKATLVRHELLLGWAFHYGIGVAYGLVLVLVQGSTWLDRPSPLAPLVLSWALLVAPYFVMMPGLGLGIAGSRTPKPNLTRLKSVLGHTAFGLGMFGTAVALQQLSN